MQLSNQDFQITLNFFVIGRRVNPKNNQNKKNRSNLQENSVFQDRNLLTLSVIAVQGYNMRMQVMRSLPGSLTIGDYCDKNIRYMGK